MDSNRVLSAELQKVVESRMDSTLKGVEETLERILERQAIQLEDLKEILKGLEESFSLLSQKWSLQILYTLFLNEGLGFGKLKSILGVNSRTLSDKLKILVRWRYVDRVVEQGPPVRVNTRSLPEAITQFCWHCRYSTIRVTSGKTNAF